MEVSTTSVKPQEAYDYWRETVYYNFEADRRPSSATRHFRADAKALIAPRGECYVYKSDSISGRRTYKQARADNEDSIDLGLVVSGLRHHESDHASDLTSTTRQFFVYDPARPSRVHWEPHEGVHLTLSRKYIEAALGRKLPPAHVIAETLGGSRLAPFLLAQLILLSQQVGTLTPYEQAFLLDNTIDLGIAAIRAATFDDTDVAPSLRQGVFVAAQRYIESHLAEPELCPAAIAATIGCSRSTLYRAFADYQMHVADYIREKRLQWFLRLLCDTPETVTITSLAHRCGFTDIANFNKVFRRRFGMSPREVRRTSTAHERTH